MFMSSDDEQIEGQDTVYGAVDEAEKRGMLSDYVEPYRDLVLKNIVRHFEEL